MLVPIVVKLLDIIAEPVISDVPIIFKLPVATVDPVI